MAPREISSCIGSFRFTALLCLLTLLLSSLPCLSIGAPAQVQPPAAHDVTSMHMDHCAPCCKGLPSNSAQALCCKAHPQAAETLLPDAAPRATPHFRSSSLPGIATRAVANALVFGQNQPRPPLLTNLRI